MLTYLIFHSCCGDSCALVTYGPFDFTFNDSFGYIISHLSEVGSGLLSIFLVIFFAVVLEAWASDDNEEDATEKQAEAHNVAADALIWTN